MIIIRCSGLFHIPAFMDGLNEMDCYKACMIWPDVIIDALILRSFQLE